MAQRLLYLFPTRKLARPDDHLDYRSLGRRYTNKGGLSVRAELQDLIAEIDALEVGFAYIGPVEVVPYGCHLNKHVNTQAQGTSDIYFVNNAILSLLLSLRFRYSCAKSDLLNPREAVRLSP